MLQKSVEACKLWQAYHVHFPRLTKYTLGGKIDTLFTDFIELLLFAGYASREQKAAVIAKANAKFDSLKFFLQVAWETKNLDHKKYTTLSTPLGEVGRMLGGWRKSLE